MWPIFVCEKNLLQYCEFFFLNLKEMLYMLNLICRKYMKRNKFAGVLFITLIQQC